MDKNVLRAIAGIEIYPLISFGIFFLFFLALLVYVAIVSRQHVHAMSHLPFDEEGNTQPQSQLLSTDVLC